LGLFHGSKRSWITERRDGKVLHAPFDGEEITRAGLHHAFVGHDHRPRDTDTHTYPGHPDPLAFGEDGERGAAVVTVAPDGRIRRQRHRVAVTQVHDLEVDLTRCRNRREVRERIATVAGKSGLARVTVLRELAPELDLKPAACLMNRADFYLINDPREKALRNAVYRAIARASAHLPSTPVAVPAGR
jgi:DNA repair exonuclease SbcCD nuclease subunit